MAYELRYDNWVTPATLPDIPGVLASARALLDSTEQWPSGKTYHGVKTLHKKVEGEASWYVRISEHDSKDGVGFEDLWRAIGENHSVNESQYVPDLKTATMLHSFEAGKVEAWDLYYKFPAPLSPRRFDVVVIIDRPDVNPREGLVVSIPYQPDGAEESNTKKAVKGKYCSIERLREDASGKVEWRMAVQSSAAGALPIFIQEMAVASKICDDVPFVLKWLKEHPAAS